MFTALSYGIRYLGGILFIAAVYFGAGKLGLALAFENRSASLVWPPTGIAIAGALVLGKRFWPGIFLGAFAVNFDTTGIVASSLGIATGNTLEAVIAAWLMERFAGGSQVFEHPKGVFQFLLLAGVGCVASASTGVVSLGLGGEMPWDKSSETWWTWWQGDIIGALLVTPPLILWCEDWRVRWTRNRAFQAVFLAGLVIVVGLIVFSDFLPVVNKDYPLVFIFLPLLIWIAFRFGRREAATATLLLAAIAIRGTLQGLGPFKSESPHLSLLILQTFLGITGVTTLLFASLAHVLEQTKTELEERVLERTSKLEQAHKRFRDLVETAPDAKVLVNQQGAIILVNAQTERMFGYRREELMGQPVELLIPKHLGTLHQKHRNQFFAKPGIRPMGMGLDLLGVRRDGQEFPVEISLSPLVTEEGTLVSAAIRDITYRKEIEKRLRQSERLAAIGEMITGLAHESRNALQRTHACLELLMLKVEERPDLLALVQDIQKAQDFLVHMYDEVRSYAAPLKLRKEKLDLGRLIREIWEHLEPERKGRQATLEIGVGSPALDFRGDPLTLNQVFRNILENSLSMCSDPVVLQVSWTDKIMDGQHAVEISFRDNGPGFAPGLQNKVFEPFFSTKIQGTGLGLAIAKRIVEAHGGTIQVGRNGRRGAEILLTFYQEKP